MTVTAAQLGTPVDLRPLMRTVRGRLDELVADLDDADWRRATVCPGWDVADLVAHVIGDDLGRLSRTHDGAAGPPWRPGEDLPAYLDRINDEWVVAFRRLSPAVLASLLGAGGVEVLDLWDDVIEVDDLTGAVSWAGLSEGVGWMDHARDTTEYWIHEQHLREATGRPLLDPDEVGTVVDVLARGLPHALSAVDAPDGRARHRHGRRPRAVVAGRAARRPLVVRRVDARGSAIARRRRRRPRRRRPRRRRGRARRRVLAPVEPPSRRRAGAFTTAGDPAAVAAVVDHVAIIRSPE